MADRWVFPRRELADTVATAAKVATPDRPWGLVEMNGPGCHIVTDDLATRIEMSVPTISAGESYSCGVPIGLMSRILSAMTGPTVAVEHQWDRLVFDDGAMRASARTSEELPPIPELDNRGHHGVIRSDRFAASFKAVAPAAAADTAAPHLSGIRLEAKYGDYWMIASDMYRLHCMRLTGNLGWDDPLTVPLLGVRLASTAIHSHTVRMATGDGRFSARGGSATVVSRCIDAPYPPWHPLVERIPDLDVETVAVFNAPELREAVTKVQDMVRGNTVHVEMSPDENRLIVSATSSPTQHGEEHGTARATVHASVNGGHSSITFATSYLKDALKPLGEGATMIAPTNGPVQFRSANDMFTAVVTWMR